MFDWFKRRFVKKYKPTVILRRRNQQPLNVQQKAIIKARGNLRNTTTRKATESALANYKVKRNRMIQNYNKLPNDIKTRLEQKKTLNRIKNLSTRNTNLNIRNIENKIENATRQSKIELVQKLKNQYANLSANGKKIADNSHVMKQLNAWKSPYFPPYMYDYVKGYLNNAKKQSYTDKSFANLVPKTFNSIKREIVPDAKPRFPVVLYK